MSDIHTHQAFGLTIAAELPLPELMPAAPEAVPDVRITFGSTPESLETPTAHGVLYQIDHDPADEHPSYRRVFWCVTGVRS
jgi:hypothetical protein